MDVREAITLIGSAAMCKESGVAKVTVDVAKKNNRFQETSAGQKMWNVCKAHALDVDGVNGNGEDGQAELPIADPLLVRIKKEELRQKAADADKRERLNEEANGTLVPAEDVAARHGLAGTHLRSTIDSVRRDLDTTLCDGCREVVLGQYDAGFRAGIEAVRAALEGE